MAQNIARTHPKLFTKKVLIPLQTKYTSDAYTDLVQSMQTREPVMPLEWNNELEDAAKDH